MGFMKWLCKKFRCESKCMFGEEDFNHGHHENKLCDYNLKYKDVEKIHQILSKRGLKSKLTNIKDMMDI